MAVARKAHASFLSGSLAAVSVGWNEQNALLDINFQEDSTIEADFNFVMTGAGEVVEVQGATEKAPISWDAVQIMKQLANKGIIEILSVVHATPVIAGSFTSALGGASRTVSSQL